MYAQEKQMNKHLIYTSETKPMNNGFSQGAHDFIFFIKFKISVKRISVLNTNQNTRVQSLSLLSF